MRDAIDTPSGVTEPKRRPRLADFFIRLVREKPLGTFGAVIVLLLLFGGIFADVLAPYDMTKIHLMNKLEGPSAKYLLGTDHLGRDVLSRIIYGARVSLIVGLGGTLAAVVVGAMIGIPSGYFGGKFDIMMQRFVDAWMAFPGLLILLTVMAIVGRGMAQIILVMGIAAGIGTSRIIRSAIIGIKENDYFVAAEAIGSTNAATVRRHIIPNIMAPVTIVFTMAIGSMILWEASLSFLGFGVPPEVASWGSMLSGEGRRFMEQKPGLALYPGLCLAVVVFGMNMLGDAMRDLLDPRLRGG